MVRNRQVLYSTGEPASVAYESLRVREIGDFQILADGLDRELLARHADGAR